MEIDKPTVDMLLMHLQILVMIQQLAKLDDGVHISNMGTDERTDWIVTCRGRKVRHPLLGAALTRMCGYHQVEIKNLFYMLYGEDLVKFE